MIFLGTTFCSGKYTLFPPATTQTAILTIMIKDGTYNHLFLSSDGLKNDAVFEWDYNTLLNADFDSDLIAGSKDFNIQKTDHLVVRRREVGKQTWVTLFVKEIFAIEDFNIHFDDKYARAEADYEYKISSYLNGIENTTIIENIYSDFDGVYITDKDCLYGTIYNLDSCDTTRNITTQLLELLNSKYVHVISNSSADYDSGSVSGVFMNYDTKTDSLDKQSTYQQRMDIQNRLANKKPLILKVHDGRIWMIRVTGNIQNTNDGHTDLRRIGFDWVEIGSIDDMKDLYGWNFVDVESRWW